VRRWRNGLLSTRLPIQCQRIRFVSLDKMPDETSAEREWLRRIVARVDRAYDKLPEPYWLSGDWPTWVRNVGRELTKTVYPTAKLKFSPHWEPGEVGAMLGQQIAYFASLPDLVQPPQKKVDWKKLRLVYGTDIKKRVRAYERKFRKHFAPEFERAIKFGLKLAIEQEYRPSSRFFAAFGRGIQRRVTSAGDIERTNTRIYILLLVAWRSVEKLGSVPALHKVLCRVFGTHLTGELKRIEKMCERLGLSYREIAAGESSEADSDKKISGLSGDA